MQILGVYMVYAEAAMRVARKEEFWHLQEECCVLARCRIVDLHLMTWGTTADSASQEGMVQGLARLKPIWTSPYVRSRVPS